MSPGSLMMSGIRIFALLTVDYNSVLISTQEMHDKKTVSSNAICFKKKKKKNKKRKENIRNEMKSCGLLFVKHLKI